MEAVKLHLYDISGGLAKALSPVLLGLEVEGLWHTTIVVAGVEYSYGPPLRRSLVGQGALGAPDRVIDLGSTALPYALREDIVANLTRGFNTSGYDLLFKNCTHFAHELSLALTGNPIPDDILNQTQVWLNSPIGDMLMRTTPAGRDHGPSTSRAPPPTMETDEATDGDAAFAELLRDIAMNMRGSGLPINPPALHRMFSLLREAAESMRGTNPPGPGHEGSPNSAGGDEPSNGRDPTDKEGDAKMEDTEGGRDGYCSQGAAFCIPPAFLMMMPMCMPMAAGCGMRAGWSNRGQGCGGGYAAMRGCSYRSAACAAAANRPASTTAASPAADTRAAGEAPVTAAAQATGTAATPAAATADAAGVGAVSSAGDVTAGVASLQLDEGTATAGGTGGGVMPAAGDTATDDWQMADD